MTAQRPPTPDNWLDILLEEARKGGYRELYIRVAESLDGNGYGEVRGSPSRRSPKDAQGWDRGPLAWHIVAAAGVSGACGNPDQHEIQVPAKALAAALPKEFKRARGRSTIWRTAARERAEEFNEARERIISKALAAWQQTEEHARLFSAQARAESATSRAEKKETSLRPGWFGRGETILLNAPEPAE